MPSTAYYGSRRFLFLTHGYDVDRRDNPYRRLSTTALISLGEPFELEIGDGEILTTCIALIAPNVLRRRVVGPDSDLLIFDFPLGSPEQVVLSALNDSAEVREFDLEKLAPLLPALRLAFAGAASCSDVGALFSTVAQQLSGQAPAQRSLDPRVVKAIALIEQAPLGEINLGVLAEQLHLSSSRLRHLFRAEIGATVSHYARWVAVWRAIEMWQRGRALTEIAHEVGFHDLAHFNHSFVEVFGLSPTDVFDTGDITLIHCP